MKVFRKSGIAIAAAVALTFSLTACTGTSTGGATPSASGSPELATAEPTSTESPFATEPETVDVPVPETVDPGQPVDVDGREVLPPVEVNDAVVDETRSVTVWLENFVAVEDAGSLPGEIGGPSVQFDVLVHNGGAEPLDLATLAVTAEYGEDKTPAEDVKTEKTLPLVGVVEPGATIRGTLVFVVPPEQRDDVTVNVDLESDARIIVFQGKVPQ